MAKNNFKFTVNEADYRALMLKMQELGDINKTPVIKQAYRQGSKILITAGKSSFLSNNKKKTGNLYRSFTNSFKKKNSGVLVGFKRGKNAGNHAHLIDKGTTDRYTKKKLYRGKIDRAGAGSRGREKTGATYFWSYIVQAKGQEAMNRIVDAIYDAINEIKNRR